MLLSWLNCSCKIGRLFRLNRWTAKDNNINDYDGCIKKKLFRDK